MNTTSSGQENRYLESPYIVKDTGSAGQSPFSIKNPIDGGILFSKKGFSTKPHEPDRAEKDKTDNEAETLFGIEQFS